MASNPRIKVLMLGWEFPPHVTGGLGTHCWNLTKAMSKLAVKIFFVTPHPISCKIDRSLHIISLNISQKFKEKGRIISYGHYFKDKIRLYNKLIKPIIEKTEFDIIHCQDRMPIKAAVMAKNISKKPLVLTVHSTEFDKSRTPRNYWINIEKEGMKAANKIIAVSDYTKDILVKRYRIDPRKIVVIPNAVKQKKASIKKIAKTKYILSLGRITYQKGIPYLIAAARKVLEKEKKVKFLIAGKGAPEYEKQLKENVKKFGLEDDIIFLGYIKDRDYYYRKAYLFVMPSVSEPFGITPLESISNGTPVMISRQSGIAEQLKNCIKFDYWDVDKLAKDILTLIKDRKRYNRLRKNSIEELKKFNWDNVAKETIGLYNDILKN